MTIEGKKILVTGGAGFIGSWIAETLASKNSVKVADSLKTGNKDNLKKILPKVEFTETDIRKREKLSGLIQGAEIVFHQGANVQIQASVDDPQMDADINIGGTLNVLDACRKHDVERVVFASSSAIYGNPSNIPVTESAKPSPLSPYALSKLAGESYMKLYSDLYGLKTISLRYFNVYGPRQNADSPYSGVISIFTKNVREGKPLTVFGDGEQTRDFVNVKDVVKANMLAAESKPAVGKAFNIGTGKSISLNDMISILEKKTGKKLVVKYKEKRKGDVMHSCPDISLARKILGFVPSVAFEDGLSELL